MLSRRIAGDDRLFTGRDRACCCAHRQSEAETVWPFIACFSIAMFGVEMTLSPSWAFCMDIGGDRQGAVSGAMNMVGNLGAAVSAVVFPYFVANVTMPYFAEHNRHRKFVLCVCRRDERRWRSLHGSS